MSAAQAHDQKRSGGEIPPLRISGLARDSIVDGPGMRLTIFVQGCPHACPGCHNPETHPFDGGRALTVDEVLAEIDRDPLMSGVTFSGGEPFCQAGILCGFARAIRARGKGLVVYSGYTLDRLVQLGGDSPEVIELLSLCDLLVDGPYVQEQRDLTLQYRGSTNQRVLDLHDPAIRSQFIG